MPNGNPEEQNVSGVKQALEALKWSWDNRDWVTKRLKELRNWFAKPSSNEESNRGILILGPGGVGKSTVGQLLDGSYESILDVPTEYDESLTLESYHLQDHPEISVVVPPGQETRADLNGILADVAAGRYRGIIFLAANGFHSIGDF